jgi:aspartate/methionine/tyrosine aminotransferase
MSKSFALAGLRIGWLATRDRALLARVASLKDYTTICNSAPSEILALIALRARSRVLDRSRAIVRENLPLLDGFFDRNSERFRWIRAPGGKRVLSVPQERRHRRVRVCADGAGRSVATAGFAVRVFG